VTAAALLGHLAARGDRRVHAATLLVTVLDSGVESQLGLFATPETIAAAKEASRLKGVLEGQEMARVFAWMRPNDLVWNYWVNNYLIGNAPPVFDILFWNNDTTRLPARFHGELLDLFQANALARPGTLTLLGTPIDLSRVTSDTYLVAGITDHITPWQGCYATTRLLGGRCEFVLSSSGHIQSLVNPPGNPKARYFTNTHYPADPESWLAGAQQQSGSWWEHWGEWLGARSGERQPAPKGLGSERYPPGTPAPGTNVFEP
jgi:polyhydroxyalkanoate synthase